MKRYLEIKLFLNLFSVFFMKITLNLLYHKVFFPIMEDNSQINNNILEKLKKFSKDKNEFQFCEALLQKELLWNDIDDPPFKREFPLSLNRFFPYVEEE